MFLEVRELTYVNSRIVDVIVIYTYLDRHRKPKRTFTLVEIIVINLTGIGTSVNRQTLVVDVVGIAKS